MIPTHTPAHKKTKQIQTEMTEDSQFFSGEEMDCHYRLSGEYLDFPRLFHITNCVFQFYHSAEHSLVYSDFISLHMKKGGATR